MRVRSTLNRQPLILLAIKDIGKWEEIGERDGKVGDKMI